MSAVLFGWQTPFSSADLRLTRHCPATRRRCWLIPRGWNPMETQKVCLQPWPGSPELADGTGALRSVWDCPSDVSQPEAVEVGACGRGRVTLVPGKAAFLCVHLAPFTVFMDMFTPVGNRSAQGFPAASLCEIAEDRKQPAGPTDWVPPADGIQSSCTGMRKPLTC